MTAGRHQQSMNKINELEAPGWEQCGVSVLNLILLACVSFLAVMAILLVNAWHEFCFQAKRFITRGRQPNMVITHARKQVPA
jgi:hypothetical protein